jgi:hypothetical protein
MSAPDAAARAIARLRDARDELELAARAPGQLITVGRQTVDRVLDDLHSVARLIREMTERGRG